MSSSINLPTDELLSKSRYLSKWEKGERFNYSYRMDFPSTPETIFPLLCPIFEYDWLNDWKCTMVYSESGVAENNCIFYKPVVPHFSKKMFFQVIQYNPPEFIEFLIHINKTGTIRFGIKLLQVNNDRTEARWAYLLTGFTRAGITKLKNYRENLIEKQVENMERDLSYWLAYKTRRLVNFENN